MYIAPDCVKVTWTLQLVGLTKPIKMTNAWSLGAGSDEAAFDDFVVDHEAAVIATILAPATFGEEYMHVSTQYDYSEDGTSVISQVVPRNVPGTSAQASAPINSAILIKKQGLRAGRANQGRMFWPPLWITEGAITPAGFLDETSKSIVQGAWNDYYDALFSSTTQAVILRQDDVSGPPSTVVGYSVDAQLATQRRRLR